jgi:hypothetical protein
MVENNVKQFCDEILLKSSETIVIVVLKLDCGCFKIGGCNIKGDLSTPLTTLSGKPIKDGMADICISCLNDSTGVGRITNTFMVFREEKMPNSMELENIMLKAFGNKLVPR